ncbi:MAG: hypothetical protein GWM92_00355 [Gemmatimonadetes bacterium]|nr:hypothetical protein [Gemmatimonadota bacterium]NIR76891.1 hypothetical protein [Gemmatimonadota bacterium]NIT85412.1 hypothetical protein [Gemmatimonadota bacterium]NIU29233.1 hypothetical protein [Gemmatimonadota bacterium]NIU34319.1 hypothetical protein [Gemmatimonadota bacterium]
MLTPRGLALALLSVLLLPAGALEGQSSEVTDPRDGRVYGTVTIGGRRWMAENLAYDAGRGSRCFADDPSNCARYGRLYTWPTALRSCPDGWHLPTEAEWRGLEAALGMPDDALAGRRYRGSDQGERLRNGGGSGFGGLLAGYMRPDGTPRRMGERAAFWTATEERKGETAWHRDLSRDPRVYRSPVDTATTSASAASPTSVTVGPAHRSEGRSDRLRGATTGRPQHGSRGRAAPLACGERPPIRPGRGR